MTTYINISRILLITLLPNDLMTTMLPKILPFSLTVLLQILVASASTWDLKMSLRDLISGHCHVVTPRVCRKFTGFDSDFTCGFILRHVCTNAYTGEQSLKMLVILFITYQF